MKLRIRGNSIRLRLTQTEVGQIREGQLVQETLDFGGGQKLHYTLEPSREAKSIGARYDDNRVRVIVPFDEALAWANSNRVEMKNAGTSDELFLLVEKDFVCLKPRVHESEDESDLFPNPNEAHGSCGGAHV